MSTAAPLDLAYQLDDRYTVESGRVFLTGNQALVRLPLMQHQRDVAAGLHTAGFISGYRGSPLGIFDMALWQAREHLEANDIRFEPGVNEDLAATAVWGSQQAQLHEGARYDGVFAMWYGKGPGVDRSCDALKHGNYAGTAPHGGVLVLAGDDPGAKSSSIAHQSEPALIHCGIPILNPSNVQDYLDFGLLGWALSRYSGCWVGFKCLTDTIESSGSVEVGPDRVRIVEPEGFERPPGLHIGWANLPLQVEQRLWEQRHAAVRAFVRANAFDRVVIDGPGRRIGVVTTGKAYLDLRQALDELGIDEARAAELGLSVYKVGMPWPLEPEGARAFARGLDDLLVLEEKQGIIEEQLATLLYNESERPRLMGKRDDHGASLVPRIGELAPDSVVEVVAGWLERCAPGFERPRHAEVIQLTAGDAPGLARLPSFCSGCPHNTSTVVPDGSVALGGIGCHGMAAFLPERRTLAVTQMGGEGSNWIGQAPYTGTKHIFQNMGDGTYFHSGLLAIRAAVTAGVNITYKILVNGAVAMTGGQPIEGEPMAGEITSPEIAHQLRAEGIREIVVLSDDIGKYRPGSFPKGVRIEHRDELDRVQRRLREVQGVTAIIYDQTCAAEARRLRKRGELPEPDRRIVINERVCEGCGDCSVQSNCISIEPIETEYGRKRTINQSSCNKDYSCLKGLCPSFVSVYGARLRKIEQEGVEVDEALFRDLPDPPPASLDRPCNLYVAGIGGTGVITVGALLGMAAHLEGKGVSLLDVTGLAQKNGPVASHVRIAARPEDLHATRIARGSADLLLGCDIVVATAPDGLAKLRPGRTLAVVNTHVAPTADFATHGDLDFGSEPMERAIADRIGDEALHAVASTRLATALLGDAIASNLFLVGYAMQLGRIPVGIPALERAIELNGRGIELNKRALRWGRLAAHDPEAVEAAARPRMRGAPEATASESLEQLVDRRAAELVLYQSARYAARYRALVDRVVAAEARLGEDRSLSEAVARYAFKLMAYKDEYEVARLFSDGAFLEQLATEFEGDYRIEFNLAPPLVAPRDPDTGRFRKFRLGPWMMPLFRLLARGKVLRGTPLDPFGWMKHRREERALIAHYEGVVDELLGGLTKESHALAVEIASLPEHVRGYDLVKERHMEDVAVKEEELLDAFRRVA